MKLSDLLAARERDLKAAVEKRDSALARQTAILDAVTAASRSALTPDEDRDVRAASDEKRAASADVERLTGEVENLRAEIEADDTYTARSAETRTAGQRPAYDEVARVGNEERTYAPHKERGFVRERNGRNEFVTGAKPGADFERDVLGALMGDYDAQDRLRRHQQEARVEHGKYLKRAVGTGAFAGLTVPQYLTDLYAPKAAAGRPFADAIMAGPGGHVLPAQGTTVDISQITTGSSNALHTENAATDETNMDDTLLAITVQEAAGQQTVSRKAIERSTGVEPIVLDDLFRRNATILDSTLLNQASTGLTNVATSVAYTDASPTAAELYPKLLAGLAAVEAALLDQSTGENIAVMHSRRWYWIQSQVGTSFPFVHQPGMTSPYQGAENLGTAYGKGVRGILPNGTPVIVDNNIATNLGTGTNEDEIYLGDRGEFHLWEDPGAPMFIRAEQTAAASLGVLLVVYSYFAYTHTRQTHAQKIAGTGLVTPTF
jgi:hypothetical protein